MASGSTAAEQPGAESSDKSGHHKALALLVLGAIGVVYGDIGTSPLYAFREALRVATEAGAPAHAPTVLGLLSLIVWTLIILVTGKYIGLVLRADNKGEGGTLSLMALAQASFKSRPLWVLVLGVMGAASQRACWPRVSTE